MVKVLTVYRTETRIVKFHNPAVTVVWYLDLTSEVELDTAVVGVEGLLLTAVRAVELLTLLLLVNG